jgi:hypothetical protein
MLHFLVITLYNNVIERVILSDGKGGENADHDKILVHGVGGKSSNR